MANETTSTTIAGLIRDIQAEVVFQFNNANELLPTVKWVDTSGVQGLTQPFAVYSQITASGITSVTEGAAFTTNTAVTNTSVDAKVAEYAIRTVLTDLSLKGDSRNMLVEDTAQLFADAMSAKVEDTIVSLFPGFSQSVGASGTLSVQNILDAVKKVRRAGSTSRGPLTGVLSYEQYYGAKGLAKLLTAPTTASAGTINEQFNQTGFVGMAYGVNWFVSNLIAETSVASGAIYSPDAIGLHSKGFMNIEQIRDPDTIGTILRMVGNWKAVEVLDLKGCEIITDIS